MNTSKKGPAAEDLSASIELWKSIFSGKEPHNISDALSKLAWDFVAFSCVVEMVRSAPGTDESKDISGLVMNFVSSGYWLETMLGVRRLADLGSIRDKRGVCSIGGLLTDIHEHRHLITRRVFVEMIGEQPYDYEVIDRRHREVVQSLGPGFHAMPRELDSRLSHVRHDSFDWLSGKSPDDRSPDDLIRPEVFEMLSERLNRLKGIVEHVHVSHAHAATEFSRNGRVLDRWSLVDAKEALRNLVELSELIGSWFCFEGVGAVIPTAQFDQFEHIELPLFAGDTDQLREVWWRNAEEISKWHAIDPETL